MNNESRESPSAPRRRFHWLRHDGIDLGDAVVQFFAVLLGVVFALFVNNWTSQRQEQAAARAAVQQQQANVDEAMRAIRAELSANRNELLRHAAYFSDMARRMQGSPANRGLPPRPCPEWQGWTGTRGTLLTDAAYQTSISTQALPHMPFAKAQSVARVYGLQQLIPKLMESDYRQLLNRQPLPLGACIGAIEEISRGERGLSSAYDPLIGPSTPASPKPSTSALTAPAASH